MIASFADAETEKVFHRWFSRKLPQDIQRSALRRLRMLGSTRTLADLREVPGLHLEKLAGDRREQHSIRINDQWRICFRWVEGNVYNVEIVDYH